MPIVSFTKPSPPIVSNVIESATGASFNRDPQRPLLDFMHNNGSIQVGFGIRASSSD